MTVPQFNSKEELGRYLTSMESRIQALEQENKELKNAMESGNRGSMLSSPVPYDLPRTGLLSKSFIQRAFTVWGHYFVAQLVIGLGFFVIYLVIMILIVVASSAR